MEKPTFDDAHNKIVHFRKSALENVISLLTIRRLDEGDFIGYCGLIIGRSTLEEPEIAFELFSSVNGKGYATEAATIVPEAAIATRRQRMLATVRSWNAASFRVLEKDGFQWYRSTGDDKGELVWNVRDF